MGAPEIVSGGNFGDAGLLHLTSCTTLEDLTALRLDMGEVVRHPAGNLRVLILKAECTPLYLVHVRKILLNVAGNVPGRRF